MQAIYKTIMEEVSAIVKSKKAEAADKTMRTTSMPSDAKYFSSLVGNNVASAARTYDVANRNPLKLADGFTVDRSTCKYVITRLCTGSANTNQIDSLNIGLYFRFVCSHCA